MSGNSGNLKRGLPVICDGKYKVVKDWVFLSAPGHNNDEIFISFTDGTSHRGLWKISTKEQIQRQIAELKKQLLMFES